jgi:hypothetical protein
MVFFYTDAAFEADELEADAVTVGKASKRARHASFEFSF